MATHNASEAGRTGRALPAQFGRYRVERLLARGGMGAVYLVTNTLLERQEALKVPDFEAGAEAEMRERFLREAKSAAGLDHPNLCPVYDVGEHDGVCYLTMRYLKGKLLSDFTHTAQPPRKAVEIVTKLAQALAAAHSRGVIHRDLKPGNVMMCAGVGPVVMDFGLAKQAQQAGRKLTRMGSILGTPAYMPPEQIKGDLTKLGPTSDVYSLGVMLFELLTGRLPFTSASEAELYAAVLFTAAPAPSSMQPGLSAVLDAICARALAKAPEDRFPSMKDFAAALIGYLKVTPPGAGGGELTASKGGTANVFEMPTVAPRPSKARAPAPTNQVCSQPTQLGGPTPSSVRPAAEPRRSASRAPIIVPRTDAGRGGLSVGAVIGGVLCFLLIGGGVGGIGALVYVINQKKADDAKVAAVAPPRVVDKNDTLPPPPPTPKPPVDGTPSVDAPPVDTPPVDTPPDVKPPVDTPPKPPASDPFVLFFEDFKGVAKDALPKNWDGDSFGVQKDEHDRPFLQVDGQGLRYVTLPRLPLQGDFRLECEVRLSGFRPRQLTPNDHELHLELSGRSSAPLTIVVDHLAGVRMGGEYNAAEGTTPFDNIRFRLTRTGNSYKVGDDDPAVDGVDIPGHGRFEQIRIGLTGGKPPVNPEAPANQFVACLYWVKITSLESEVPKLDPNEPDPPPALFEDFRKATAGAVPDGWGKGKFNNLAVRASGGSLGLELIDPVKGGDGTILPRIDLQDDFYVDVAAEFPQPSYDDMGNLLYAAAADSSVALLFRGPNTKDLVVQLYYGGSVVVPNRSPMPGAKYWVSDRPNRLRVERSSKDQTYLIRLNDALVGRVPLGAGPGPFTEIELEILLSNAKQASPRVTSVGVVPLVPDP